jgi:hypothetical protein
VLIEGYAGFLLDPGVVVDALQLQVPLLDEAPVPRSPLFLVAA